MKSIWKFPLSVVDTQKVAMPFGATILSVDSQHDQSVCLWAMVNTEASPTDRTIVIVGTGHEVPEGNLMFIGTTLLFGGGLVFHVFEAAE